MILFVPHEHAVDAGGGEIGTARFTAILDETTRTVVADRMRPAGTRLRRLLGITVRERLGEDEALWLMPCRRILTLGSKFAIDAVFLDEGLKVIAVRENVGPWRSSGTVEGAASAIQLPAGAVRKTDIAVGHQMGFVPGILSAPLSRRSALGHEDH